LLQSLFDFIRIRHGYNWIGGNDPYRFDSTGGDGVKHVNGFQTLPIGNRVALPKTPHPIDMTRYQLAGCYMGRAGLINSGGASGDNDLHDAVSTAVVNKRAGGMGMISGRKAFQRPRHEGIALLNAIQDVYLCDDVTIA
jgi:hypothetical protein